VPLSNIMTAQIHAYLVQPIVKHATISLALVLHALQHTPITTRVPIRARALLLNIWIQRPNV